MATLQDAPGDPLAQAEVSNAATFLRQVEVRKSEGQRLRSRISWKEKEDQGTKEFYRAHKARSSASHITALEDKGGQVQTGQGELGQICQSYYQRLYTARAPTEEARAAENEALNCLEDRVPADIKHRLRAPLTKEELKKAVDDMKPGKAPGPDGTSLEFYKIFWDDICDDFFLMITGSIQQDKLPVGVTHGMITLLHKEGSR